MKRAKFSLSHYRLMSGDMGELLPCAVVEVLPGDSIQQSTQALIRMQPQLAPVMHPVHARIHHWFVPHRLVWEDWEDFITGGPDGEDDSALPTIDMGGSGAAVGSLADYLGIPTGVAGLDVSALPFRAYAMIWNEFYRDQDLQTALTIDETSGVDTTTNTTLQNVDWEKDYFTTARPWPQKGPDITLPLGTEAPVVGDGNPMSVMNAGGTPYTVKQGPTHSQNMWADPFAPAGTEILYHSTTFPGLKADLTGATAVDVNDVRRAFALQRFAEVRARYGSRYSEYLRYLRVRSSDARLQRPEYLGGGRNTIQFSEVLQTGVTTDGDDSDGVGNLKGHAIGAMRSNRYRRFFEEHGYIISVVSVKPKTMYTQGLPRTWNRRTREDFWQKELQHIGQQEILNKELYAAHASPDATFGYQDRYDEYRRMESGVSGEFRTTELDFWHMARIFGSSPTLNADFVKSVPTKRIFPTQDNDVLWMCLNHSIQARRLVDGSASSYIF